jgi:hypothetical protein
MSIKKRKRNEMSIVFLLFKLICPCFSFFISVVETVRRRDQPVGPSAESLPQRSALPARQGCRQSG